MSEDQAKDAGPAQVEPASATDAELLARFQNARTRPPGSELLGLQVTGVRQALKEVEASFDAKGDVKNGALTLFTYKGGNREQIAVVR